MYHIAKRNYKIKNENSYNKKAKRGLKMRKGSLISIVIAIWLILAISGCVSNDAAKAVGNNSTVANTSNMSVISNAATHNGTVKGTNSSQAVIQTANVSEMNRIPVPEITIMNDNTTNVAIDVICKTKYPVVIHYSFDNWNTWNIYRGELHPISSGDVEAYAIADGQNSSMAKASFTVLHKRSSGSEAVVYSSGQSSVVNKIGGSVWTEDLLSEKDFGISYAEANAMKTEVSVIRVRGLGSKSYYNGSVTGGARAIVEVIKPGQDPVIVSDAVKLDLDFVDGKCEVNHPNLSINQSLVDDKDGRNYLYCALMDSEGVFSRWYMSGDSKINEYVKDIDVSYEIKNGTVTATINKYPKEITSMPFCVVVSDIKNVFHILAAGEYHTLGSRNVLVVPLPESAVSGSKIYVGIERSDSPMKYEEKVVP